MVTPPAACPTARCVDEYCEQYADLFPEVRSFEAFKHLHVSMISDLKRKALPAIAKAVSLENEQGLHHLLTNIDEAVDEVTVLQSKRHSSHTKSEIMV